MKTVVEQDQAEHEDGASTVADQRPAVSILIVGYNTKDLLMDCLLGLFEHTAGLSFEVLYVDCSNDGSVQATKERFPLVRVIDNDENLGFGRGNNFLATHARGQFLLLLNPDTLIKDNAVGELYEFALRTPYAGAWGGVTYLPNGEIDPSCQQVGFGLGKAVLQLFGLRSVTCPTAVADDGQGVDVPSLSGAFMMISRSLWQQLEGFDESFFMYCEETDLCHRVRLSSHRVLITSRASVTHLVGSGSAQSPKRMLALTRGGVHLTRKHHGRIYVYADVAIRWLYSASRFGLGMVGAPLIGGERAAQLRSRHAPILLQPSKWTGGWSPRSSAKTKPEVKSS